jgi:hypothetical protein
VTINNYYYPPDAGAESGDSNIDADEFRPESDDFDSSVDSDEFV